MTEKKLIPVGKISSPFGIKGWVKIFSFTDPRENIFKYLPWILSKEQAIREVKTVTGNFQGKILIAKIDGVSDRDQAAELNGWEISVHHDQLQDTEHGEYYWSDLIGLTVENVEGQALGVVTSILETGANDVLVVQGERERAIPFLPETTIIKVDLSAKQIVVDWDVDF